VVATVVALAASNVASSLPGACLSVMPAARRSRGLGDTTTFIRQAAVGADLWEFSVCAGLLNEQ